MGVNKVGVGVNKVGVLIVLPGDVSVKKTVRGDRYWPQTNNSSECRLVKKVSYA